MIRFFVFLPSMIPKRNKTPQSQKKTKIENTTKSNGTTVAQSTQTTAVKDFCSAIAILTNITSITGIFEHN